MVDVRENCKNVRDRVALAAARAGRDPADISVVAVTKTRSAAEVEAVISAGYDQVGENRIQEAEAKKGTVSGVAGWHLVGHLQTNKAKRAVALFDLVQSVDSVRIGGALNGHAAAAGRVLDVLLQVNTSGAAEQSGIRPEEADGVVGLLREMSHLRLRGLMTIGAFVEDESVVRACFARLRSLRDELIAARTVAAPDLQYLSMGMSGDFELAIDEGSNMVRLGTTIFGPRT